jgi:hypothetical protein
MKTMQAVLACLAGTDKENDKITLEAIEYVIRMSI